jgi:ADP-heptose:LPS heptosyltransferase
VPGNRSGRPTTGIILCRPHRVGDVIIATACLPALRRQRPDERIVFVAREAMRPLLEDHPLLDAFIGLPAEPGFAARLGSLAAAFRAHRDTAIVHLHPDKLCQLAAWRAGIPRRIGYRSSFLADWTLTHSRMDRRREGRQHEALANFDLLAELGVRPPPLAELRPSVHLSERSQASLRARLASAGCAAMGKYIVLNPTAHSPTHRWPAENFAWLARELRSRCDRIVLIGEPADDPAVKALRAALAGLHGDLADLAGVLNLAELGWLLRDAALLVSRNTGTTHLAAAVGCPTVELFGRLEPAYGPGRWRSLGASVRAVETTAPARRRGESKQAFWRRGFAAVPREDVLAAALGILAGSGL